MTTLVAVRVVLRGDIEVEMQSWQRISGSTPDIGSFERSSDLSGPGPVVVIADQAAAGDAVRALRDGGAAGGVIVVGANATADDAWAALDLGATGFVQLESPVEELITAIRATGAGHYFVPAVFLPALAGRVRSLCRSQADTCAHGLTVREFDVLRMLAEGSSNAEIARNLFISESTVRTHVLAILRKVGARNRTEAVVLASRKGMLGDD
jgi:DNA-binding NarL/FixJ family response regulator